MAENKTPGSEDLAAWFPDVYLELQCAQLKSELQDEHHYQSSVTMNGNEASALVQLNDDFLLLLTPAIPGFGGYKNWLLIRTLTDPRTRREIQMPQYLAGVELILGYGTADQQSLLNFGLDAGEIGQLIGRALEKIRALRTASCSPSCYPDRCSWKLNEFR